MTKILDFSNNSSEVRMPDEATLFQLCCIAETRCFAYRNRETGIPHCFAYLPDAQNPGWLAIYCYVNRDRDHGFFTYQKSVQVQSEALKQISAHALELLGEGDWQYITYRPIEDE